jgi:membrane fusion protein (multidrug efflux system)
MAEQQDAPDPKASDDKDKPSDEAQPKEDAAKDGKEDKGEGDKEDDKKGGLKQHPMLIVVGVVALVVLLIAALLFWLHERHFQSTDDAFIDTHIVRLAPQVSGRVTQVLVNDNQTVAPGQLLVMIDSADARTQVAQAQAKQADARAQFDNAREQISVNQAAYEQARASIAAAQAQADNANRDLARYLALQKLNPAAVAQQQLDQAQSQTRQANANRDAAVKAAAGRADQVKASRLQAAGGADEVSAAKAELDQANITLGYAQIAAPVAGHVAELTVANGNYVQAGTQLLAIVPLQIWVTANFKETQLAYMRVGQSVLVKADACAGAKVEGHVDSIQRGAGQAFAILPPENATGNYVKVVQRVPVKIVLDRIPAGCTLGPGMSVEPRVRVR